MIVSRHFYVVFALIIGCPSNLSLLDLHVTFSATYVPPLLAAQAYYTRLAHSSDLYGAADPSLTARCLNGGLEASTTLKPEAHPLRA